MAINPASQYPGQITPASTDYPYGSARDVSSPGAGDGTPVQQAWVNDWFGFQQRVLQAAGITPSGNPDTAVASDVFDGLIGRLIGIRVFSTAGTFTYTPTTGTKSVKVIVTGAGGLGLGNTSTTAPPGAGGGAGGTSIKFIKNIAASYSVVVGAPATTPVRSGSSSFGSECSATGGNFASAGAGGEPGIGTGGNVNLYGGWGSDAADPALGSGSGDGGASYWGGGQRAAANAAQPSVGAPGSGGGGNRAQNVADRYKGLPGIVYIEEYS